MFFPMDFPVWDETESWIKINGQTIPLVGGLNIQQSYEPEELGSLERSLDGGLVFMGIPDLGFRINTSISGEGNFTPHFMSFRPWQQIELECALPIYMPGQVNPNDLLRPHVPGSIRYYKNHKGGNQSYLRAVGGEGMDPDPEVVWTGFRPILIVQTSTFSYGFSSNEARKTKSWTWDLREHMDMRDL